MGQNDQQGGRGGRGGGEGKRKLDVGVDVTGWRFEAPVAPGEDKPRPLLSGPGHAELSRSVAAVGQSA